MKTIKTIALTLLALNLLATQTQAQTTSPAKSYQEDIKVRCVRGRWKITYARDQKVIEETKAHQLEGKPCKSTKTYGEP